MPDKGIRGKDIPERCEDEEPEYSYPGGCVNPRTEHLVVTCLLGEKRGITLKRLRRELDDLDPAWIDESIESLERAGVVFVSDTTIHGTPAVQRLDDLDAISI
jgi:hypothetical protein